MIPVWLLRFLPYVIAVVAAAGGLWLVHHYGYSSGQAEREAHYGPILQQAERAKVAAESRALALERASVALNINLEKQHAESVKALESRASGAEQRLAGSLRKLASCGGSGQVPGVPGSPSASDGAGGGEGGADGTGARIADTGKRCERDALRLDEWRQWYLEQSALSKPSEK